jgi:predicted N-formylglutamate amidohydrolase
MPKHRLHRDAVYFVVTCEHGGNRIPPRYRPLFASAAQVLRTHRGFDAGALTLARELARALDAPLFASTTSRLLIDLNRSIAHPRLYSEFTRHAPPALRQEILERHYLRYRDKVESCIAQILASGQRVIHISSHSFTPELDGNIRNADIGLLYDPARRAESALCACWKNALRAQTSGLKTRLNYPYRGTADGLTTYLRRRFGVERYAGIEVEINQKHVLSGARHWRGVRAALIEGLRAAAGW